MMSDNLTPENRKKTMRAVKSKGSVIEKRLWSMLAGMGLKGWKKNVQNVIGKPDIVFPEKKIVIFIDGCFWHGCPICQRILPKTNTVYWERKIGRNKELAKSYDEALIRSGWKVMRIWEHEMKEISNVRIKVRILIDSKE